MAWIAGSRSKAGGGWNANPGSRSPRTSPLSTAVVGDGLIMLKRVPCDITCHMQMLCLPPDDPLLRVRWALTEPGNKANSNQACIEYC